MFCRPFLVLLALTLLAACSQAPWPGAADADVTPTTFGTPRYDEATGLASHSFGVYTVGYTRGDLHGPQLGDGDAFIRKVNTSGTLLWGRQFGTPARDDAADVAGDSSDHAYVVGYTRGSLAGWRGEADAFIRKVTPSGNVAWTRQFGTPVNDWANGVAVSGSSVYVVGATRGDLAGRKGSADLFVRKYDAQGRVLWTRQFGTSTYDEASDVAVDRSGGVYVVGSVSGPLPGATRYGGRDMVIRKYSPEGAVLWTRQLHYGDEDTGRAVAVSGDHVYLVGSWRNDDMPSGPMGIDARIVKYTSSGVRVWDKSDGSIDDDFVYDASADSKGNLYLVGESDNLFGESYPGSSSGYILKLDADGNRIVVSNDEVFFWLRDVLIGERTIVKTVLVRTDAQIYVAGLDFISFEDLSKADAFLRRLRGSDGATVWTD